ncbi:MAG: integration host factor subunit beta [Planctomycetes bacterium]|nr:integration host factor subunit beta [Planctomycetota bacterium]
MAEKIDGNTVTKKDLVLRIAESTGHKQSVTRVIIQEFIDEIIGELASGNRLELRDFGVFEVRFRHPRQARNPKTGEQVQVPPKRVVTIKPGKKMKDIISRAPIPASLTGAAQVPSTPDDDEEEEI